MQLKFREAGPGDIPEVLRLLRDDILGQGREGQDLATYIAAFERMQAEGNNHLIVGEAPDGTIVATYQLTLISGLSLSAARRAQIESVRIDGAQRGQGLGAQMLADAEARARAGGCSLMQLTMNSTRKDAHRFYTRQGFIPSHTGFKKPLR